ncbi:inactive rhomboid protein 2-like [Mizuhopecten yessoensis]|uniref:inactive rhomboid protein 2-like n=1 Tax=Mizuhopecten yessoensis TaxID=6573 RepID=UPI000B45C1C8|nr:inactive rhomboid protein 2-like [Mizuhopecten yessoensis]XP_021371861.1 inactive rhomboid protein 2-like [Mizuhopecten yessoensis]XP_021371862.1 inactive rhomboid protein 2-like [Mizuhopecten yessoensis]
MADLVQHQETNVLDQQYEFGGMITSIFQSSEQASEEGLIDCLQDALQDIISQESEEYTIAKKTLEKDRSEVVDLKSLEPYGSDFGPSLDETVDEILTDSNSIRKCPQEVHVNIEIGEENNFQQEESIPTVSDFILSVNNSASRNVFQDSESGTCTDKTTTSDLPYHLRVVSENSEKSENLIIKKTHNDSNSEDLDQTSEHYRITKSVSQTGVRFKSSSDVRDTELGIIGKNINYSANTNYSANGQDSASKQEEEKKTNNGKMEAAGVNDSDPPGNDDDTAANPKPIITKEQGTRKDRDVTDQHNTPGENVGEKLNTKEKDPSQNEGESCYQTTGDSGNPRKDEGKDMDEVENVILIEDPKRKEHKFEENDQEIGNPQEERKHKHDLDLNTESEHSVKNGRERQTVLKDNKDSPDMPGANDSIHFAEDSTSEESVEKLSLKDLAFGNEGYKHFKLYAKIDKNIRVDELVEAKEALKMNYDWRIRQIDEIIDVAKAYYKNPKNSKAVTEWHELKKTVSVDKRSAVKSNTDIKFHLASLHEHRTIFTYILIVMQLVSVVVTCILGKLTFIGLEPKLELMAGMKTFIGTEMVHKWIPPNVWIGPSERYLISIGALYAPCMREDFGIQIDYSKEGYSKTSTLGCCEVAGRNVAGTTTLAECVNSTNGIGVWREGVLCSERPSGQNSVGHVLKPCCTGLRGQCQLLSHEHCQFLEGSFHVNGPEHCSQVNCLSSVCGMGGLEADPIQPWLPRDPIQWWRLPLSLVYHHGVIHAVLVSLAQVLLFRKIERTLGWLRLTIVYLMTGLGGLLTAAVFNPYVPHVGGTATVFGMAGLITVELIHYWHIVKKPAVELTKICGLLVVFLMLGTLPYIDNYSIVSGFLLGVICSVLFLPFLSFRQQQKHCRIVLLCVGGPLIFLVYFVLLYVFYKVQTFEECSGCKLFNCVPYTETMCDPSLWTQE